MTIKLDLNNSSELFRLARHCHLRPEILALAFVEDGIRAYSSSDELDELKGTLDGENL